MRSLALPLLIALVSLPLSSQTINDFHTAAEYPTFTSANPMALMADFNKDGKQDLLTFGQNGQGGQICVALGNGDGTFQKPNCTTQVNPPYLRAAAVGDFNGDGLPDVVIAADCQDQPNPTCGSGSLLFLLGNGDGTFTQSSSYETLGISDQAFTVAVGDLNGDGKADIVATLACNNVAVLGCTQAAILVFLGDGSGKFTSPSSTYIPIFGNGSLPVMVADVNGDGRPDIIIGNQYAPDGQTHSSISVLLGQSGGGFACPDGSAVSPGNPLPGGCTMALPFYGIYDLVAADFNGDGHLDLATTGTYSGVNVLYGNGNGTFQLPPLSIPVSTQSTTTLAQADLNSDGHPDLIVASDPWEVYGASSINILLNDGTGNFQVSPAYQGGGWNQNSVVVGDFDGDGKPDVVLSTYCSGTPSNTCIDGTQNLWFGNGDGTLRGYPILPFASLASDDYPIELVADINGDGVPDLMRIARDSGTNGSMLSISLGTGGGNFEAPYEIGLGQGNGYVASSAVLGDFNHDGNLDLAVAFVVGSNGDGAVSVLLGDGKGNFQIQPSLDTGGVYARSIATADLRGNGNLDLVVANQCADPNCNNGSFTALIGDGSGGFSALAAIPTPDIATDTSVVLGDFNGDGKLDLAIGGSASAVYCGTVGCQTYDNAISVFVGNGDGTFSADSTYDAGGTQSGVSLVLGDVNRDGNLDLIATNSCSELYPSYCAAGGGIGVFLGNGNGNFTRTSPIAIQDAEFFSANLFDLNGDGKLDLIAATGSGVYVAYGNGDGTFAPGVLYAGLGRISQSILAVADVNGDGAPDIVVPGILGLAAAYGSNPATAILYNQLPVVAVPKAPSSLTASAVSNTEIDLAWKNNANNATQLDIEESTNGTTFTQITASTPSTTTYAVTGLNLGTEYWFRVRAQNTAGFSGYSNVANATTLSPQVTLSTNTINFGIFQVGGAYAIPQVKLTNAGTGALTINSIKNVGANPNDFSNSNNCPISSNTLGAGLTCTFFPTFTPIQLGARAASISIADNATGSPQSISLSGTAVDFSVSVAPASTTTKGGKAATFTISVTPLGGNTLTAGITVTGCPTNASCTLSKSSFALNGSTASTSTLSVKAGGKTPNGAYPITIAAKVFTVTHSTSATFVLQ